MRLCESLMNSEVSLDQQEELIKKEYQKSILMIGGIQIFLPHSSVDSRKGVSDGATIERQPTETVKEEEEIEQTLTFSQGAEDEHSAKMLKIFSREDKVEMTAALKPTVEEEAYNMNFIDMCEELEALERRVIVQSLHIQQAKLEEGSGAYQPQEKLEEVGSMTAGEMETT